MNEDEMVVLKVMSTSRYFGSYEGQNEYVAVAKEQLHDDEDLRKCCILQSEDTERIYMHGEAIRVLEPQCYDAVSTLDKSSYMFHSNDDWAGVCYGAFREEDGNAVSGSGGDHWYKITPELVAFCKRVDAQARALAQDVEDPTGALGWLESKAASVGEKDAEIKSERRRVSLMAELLMEAERENAKECFHAKQAIAKRKIELLESVGAKRKR